MQGREPHCPSFSHLCPYRSVDVQIAAQRFRSQKPSPHSSSFVQWRFGTFLDHGRAGSSSAIALSSGERAGLQRGSSTLASGGGSTVGVSVSAGADGETALVVANGVAVLGSGRSTRRPPGTSSLDTQEIMLARPTDVVSPTMNDLLHILLICVFMAICTRGSCHQVPPGERDPPPMAIGHSIAFHKEPCGSRLPDRRHTKKDHST